MKNEEKVRYYKRTFYDYKFNPKSSSKDTEIKIFIRNLIYKVIDGKLYMYDKGRWFISHWKLNDEFTEITEQEAFIEII